MGLPPPPPADWPDEIAAAAATEMKATAHFYSGSGDNLTHLFSTKARVQHLRGALDASTVTEWATKRAIRIQVPLDATTGMIVKGLIVQVGPGVDDNNQPIPLRDPTLGEISFTVQSAVNSSQAAVRTVECISQIVPSPRVP